MYYGKFYPCLYHSGHFVQIYKSFAFSMDCKFRRHITLLLYTTLDLIVEEHINIRSKFFSHRRNGHVSHLRYTHIPQR